MSENMGLRALRVWANPHTHVEAGASPADREPQSAFSFDGPKYLMGNRCMTERKGRAGPRLRRKSTEVGLPLLQTPPPHPGAPCRLRREELPSSAQSS